MDEQFKHANIIKVGGRLNSMPFYKMMPSKVMSARFYIKVEYYSWDKSKVKYLTKLCWAYSSKILKLLKQAKKNDYIYIVGFLDTYRNGKELIEFISIDKMAIEYNLKGEEENDNK